jgi:hypothetical protein
MGAVRCLDFQVWGMSGTGFNFRAVLSTMLVAAKLAIAT